MLPYDLYKPTVETKRPSVRILQKLSSLALKNKSFQNFVKLGFILARQIKWRQNTVKNTNELLISTKCTKLSETIHNCTEIRENIKTIYIMKCVKIILHKVTVLIITLPQYKLRLRAQFAAAVCCQFFGENFRNFYCCSFSFQTRFCFYIFYCTGDTGNGIYKVRDFIAAVTAIPF